ncbi:response regulator [Deinococcus pimensis]|uniref:response regulator n=1 Tax=Deinococcus pimensis TaxID=309888 RepID=UPI00048608ED|nr:response regulator [Deinococcus pimensis]
MTQAVLVVDDEPVIRHLIEHVLARAGCTVVTAGDGEAALGVLDERPDVRLIISDLGMPVLDGFALLERVRERSGPPVLILTSRGDEDDERRARALGAADVITKPFSRQDLLRVVRPHLEL